MEIQKVFSDYYDTERMYSVIMNERELRLFAAAKDADEELDQKKNGLSTRNKIALGVAGLGGVGAAAAYGAEKFADRMVNKSRKKIEETRSKLTDEELEKLTKKLSKYENKDMYLRVPMKKLRQAKNWAGNHKVLAGLGAAGVLGAGAYGYHALGD